MTVIAAIRHDDTVWMGADTQTTDGTGRVWPDSGKLLRVQLAPGHTALAGCAGHRGIRSLIRRQLTDPDYPFDHHDQLDEWAQHVADRLAVAAREPGPKLCDNDGHLDACLLLAYNAHCYAISDGVAARVGVLTAIGSGGDLALGALTALHPRLDDGLISPAEALRTAIEIAGSYDDACSTTAIIEQLRRP